MIGIYTERFIRRTADILASTVALAVLSPVLAVIAILVKKDSSGPVIFKQTRVGKNNRLFTIYKFRSMKIGDNVGPFVTAKYDLRITHLGAKLRDTKLDELPQLVNVLRGDMSIVGPRPEVPQYVERWPTDAAKIILSVRPGLTDPVTLKFRDEETILSFTDHPESHHIEVLMPIKTKSYVQYVSSRSLLSDTLTIGRTITSISIFSGQHVQNS